ncbi:hypothetical protein [Zobellella taiwanensis]
MSDNKPGLIAKWIHEATDEQLSHAANYMQSKGWQLPQASSLQQSLFHLYTDGVTQSHPYPSERWVTFQQMTAHCRHKKHKLYSGKVQLSASIGRENKEKLERIAKEMNISQSAVLELLIENAEKIKSKQKREKKGAAKSHYPSAGDIPTGPKTFVKSIFQKMSEGNYTISPIASSGNNKDAI